MYNAVYLILCKLTHVFLEGSARKNPSRCFREKRSRPVQAHWIGATRRVLEPFEVVVPENLPNDVWQELALPHVQAQAPICTIRIVARQGGARRGRAHHRRQGPCSGTGSPALGPRLEPRSPQNGRVAQGVDDSARASCEQAYTRNEDCTGPYNENGVSVLQTPG